MCSCSFLFFMLFSFFLFFKYFSNNQEHTKRKHMKFHNKWMQDLVYRKTRRCVEKEKFNFKSEISMFQREFRDSNFGPTSINRSLLDGKFNFTWFQKKLTLFQVLMQKLWLFEVRPSKLGFWRGVAARVFRWNCSGWMKQRTSGWNTLSQTPNSIEDTNSTL
jgi:hypothetical protein